MLVSFRAHLLSCVITIISFIFTCISLFSCHWVSTRAFSVLFYVRIGLIDQCGISAKQGWAVATLVFMIIAFILQCLVIIHLLISFIFRRYNVHVLKTDSTLIGLATFCLFVAWIVFVIGVCIDFRHTSYSFGWSWILAIIASVLSLIAGMPVGHAYKRIHYHGDCECQGYYY